MIRILAFWNTAEQLLLRTAIYWLKSMTKPQGFNRFLQNAYKIILPGHGKEIERT